MIRVNKSQVPKLYVLHSLHRAQHRCTRRVGVGKNGSLECSPFSCRLASENETSLGLLHLALSVGSRRKNRLHSFQQLSFGAWNLVPHNVIDETTHVHFDRTFQCDRSGEPMPCLSDFGSSRNMLASRVSDSCNAILSFRSACLLPQLTPSSCHLPSGYHMALPTFGFGTNPFHWRPSFSFA